jgi:hypothetical protein
MAGWLRRNAWGLVLLLPASAVVAVPAYLESYDSFLRNQPRVPVAPRAGADHWVTFSTARMRLEQLSEESTLPTYDDKTVAAPSGMRVVKAVLDFDGIVGQLGGCRLFLESTTGEQYAEKPVELTSVDRVSLPEGGCAPEDPPFGSTPSPSPRPSDAPSQWKTVCYFVMPLSAYPSGVRVTLTTEQPRYALLK